jgi:hypothetical protein
MFSFRNDPNFWYLDDASVTSSSGQQLLSNGDFGQGQGSLANWVYCNPNNASYAGTISSSYFCYSYYCYVDGSVGAFDYLSQTFNVQPNNTYTVAFLLAVSGNNPANKTAFANIGIFY